MYVPTVINETLSVLRWILDIAVDSGVRYDNPAKDKDVKRARARSHSPHRNGLAADF
jgi:hypothetical protein